jgi:membrane-associated phospholipid phosphatase
MKAWVTIMFLGCFLIGQINADGQEIIYERIGDIFQLALPAAAGISTVINPEDNYSGTKEFVYSMLATSALTIGLKVLIDKERPNGGRWAFPSGHTSSAFTGAAFLHRKYGLKVGVPAFSAASYVAWSRIHATKHDFEDILGGIIIALGSVYTFTEPRMPSDLTIVPAYSDNSISLSAFYTF